jgi:hypothetical protein
MLKLFFINIKGIEAGFSEQEFGIRLDTNVLMVCTVTFGIANNAEPIISNVTFIGESAADILKAISSKQWTLGLITLFYMLCGVFFTVTILISGNTILQDLKRRRLGEMANNALANASTLTKQDIVTVEDFPCNTCKNDPKSVLFNPCKHLLYCRGCWEKKTDHTKCDKCNKAIVSCTILYLN